MLPAFMLKPACLLTLTDIWVGVSMAGSTECEYWNCCFCVFVLFHLCSMFTAKPTLVRLIFHWNIMKVLVNGMDSRAGAWFDSTKVTHESTVWHGKPCHWLLQKYGEDGGGGHWLVRMEWRPAGWSVRLPLLIFPCTMKSRSSVLAPAQPGGPGKRAVKRLWCLWWSLQLKTSG